MIKKICEHLVTRKEYNTLKNLYDVKCKEYDDKVIDFDTQLKINKAEKTKFKNKLKEYVDEIAELTERLQKYEGDKDE